MSSTPTIGTVGIGMIEEHPHTKQNDGRERRTKKRREKPHSISMQMMIDKRGINRKRYGTKDVGGSFGLPLFYVLFSLVCKYSLFAVHPP